MITLHLKEEQFVAILQSLDVYRLSIKDRDGEYFKTKYEYLTQLREIVYEQI